MHVSACLEKARGVAVCSRSLMPRRRRCSWHLALGTLHLCTLHFAPSQKKTAGVRPPVHENATNIGGEAATAKRQKHNSKPLHKCTFLRTFFAAVPRPRGASALGRISPDAVAIMSWQTAAVAPPCPRLPRGWVEAETARSVERRDVVRGVRLKPLAAGVLLRAKAPAAILKICCILEAWCCCECAEVPMVFYFLFSLSFLRARNRSRQLRPVEEFPVQHGHTHKEVIACTISLSSFLVSGPGMLEPSPPPQQTAVGTSSGPHRLDNRSDSDAKRHKSRPQSGTGSICKNTSTSRGRQGQRLSAIMDGDGDILGMRRKPEAVQPAAPTSTSAGAGGSAPETAATATATAATAAAARYATGASPLKRQRSVGGGSLARVESEVSNIYIRCHGSNGNVGERRSPPPHPPPFCLAYEFFNSVLACLVVRSDLSSFLAGTSSRSLKGTRGGGCSAIQRAFLFCVTVASL